MSVITYPDGSQLLSTAQSRLTIETAWQIATAQMLGILTSPLTMSITLVLNSASAVVANATLLYPGELIVATGIPANTTILSVTGTTIVMSANATVAGLQTASVTDPQYPFKVRIGWAQFGEIGPSIDADTVGLTCIPVDTEYARMHDQVYTPNGDPTLITTTDVFTRAWRVRWIFYGPNSLDHARAVKSAIIGLQFVSDLLATYNIYVNPDVWEVDSHPENFEGQWWERADLQVNFNEQVTETFTVGAVESVEILMYNKDGKVADFTIT